MDNYTAPAEWPTQGTRERGKTRYQLTNHLSNVLAMVSDLRSPVATVDTDGDGTDDARILDAGVIGVRDYYPFGGDIEGRTLASGTPSDAYKYGFNGKEDNPAWSADAVVQDYGFRLYSPGIGRFLSTDPLTAGYPFYTPYQFAGNKPIMAVDLDGLEEKIAIVMEKKPEEFSQNAIGLENAGYVILYASSGQDALLKLKASHHQTNIPTQHLVFLSHGFEGGLVGPTEETGFYSDEYEQFQIIDHMMDVERNEEYEVSSVTHRSYEEARELYKSKYPNGLTISEFKSAVDDGSVLLTSDVTIAIGRCNAGISCETQALYDTPNALDSEGLPILRGEPGNFAQDLSVTLGAPVLSATKPVRNDRLYNEGGQTNPGTGNTTYRNSASDAWHIFQPDGTSQPTNNSRQNLDLSNDDGK